MRLNEKRPVWFKMWLHHKPMMEVVPDAVVGKAVKAALKYFDTGEIEPLDQMENIIFAAIRADADDAHAEYSRNVENGRKGGRPKLCPEEKPPVREGNPPLPSLPQVEGEVEGEVDVDVEDYTVLVTAVSLLNQLSGSSFRDTSRATRKLIRARLQEGYNISDFEAVIRHQCSLWGKDEKMRKYLRPETLFSGKFEGYLSDARRRESRAETGYVLAPLEDPWEEAVKEDIHA